MPTLQDSWASLSTAATRALFLRNKGDARESDADSEARDESPAGEHGALLCRACGARVAELPARLEVDGRHRHTFFNPAGLVFVVLCFRRAAGCVGLGPRSLEFTWFAGHRWQIGLCRACGEHLGWWFSGPSEFVALDAARVIESP